MIYPCITTFCLIVTWLLGSDPLSVWLLALGQLILLLRHILSGQLTAVGAFLFMSFLFFGMRAIYLVVEDDYELFTNLFKIPASPEILTNAVWWATAGMLLFYLGGELAPYLHRSYFSARRVVLHNLILPPQVNTTMVIFLLTYQLATLPLMLFLAGQGRSLYGSAIGAYLYDLPMLLQAGHVFALVVIFERWLREHKTNRMIALGLSGILFLIITWQMRNVTMFRGFYLTGIMVAGIAMLTRMQRRVSFFWLILPIILLQPPFRALGASRELSNEEISKLSWEERLFGGKTAMESYWSFYDSKGDINILDTFAAATVFEPEKRPYALSWVYVPFHFVPRALWASKPEKGILQDIRFANGAPYSPGITGFFLLDGGFLWMLGCMALVGYLVSFVDFFILTMPKSYLRCCLLGIFVVNAMFLTRFYLWQSFYQILYAAAPCIALAWYLDRRPILAHFGGLHRPALPLSSKGNLPNSSYPKLAESILKSR